MQQNYWEVLVEMNVIPKMQIVAIRDIKKEKATTPARA